MSNQEILELYILFPVMDLDKVYDLTYGRIGPITKLESYYPKIVNVKQLLRDIYVNNIKKEDYVFAVSNNNFRKFMKEIECIRFIIYVFGYDIDVDEVFKEPIMFSYYKYRKKDWIMIDRTSSIVVGGYEGIWLPSLTKNVVDFFRNSTELSNTFNEYLNNPLYKAIMKCFTDEKDFELKSEKSRIITSINLFNKANIDELLINPTSSNKIIYIAIAFEALLNLPERSINSTFYHSLTTLIGLKTTTLKSWCKQFYDYRSKLVHGVEDYDSEEKRFQVDGGNGEYHSIIARELFIYCLKTKLFLMGLLDVCERERLNLETLFYRHCDSEEESFFKNFQT